MLEPNEKPGAADAGGPCLEWVELGARHVPIVARMSEDSAGANTPKPGAPVGGGVLGSKRMPAVFGKPGGASGGGRTTASN